MQKPNPIKQDLADIFPIQHRKTETKIESSKFTTLLKDYALNINTSKHILSGSDVSLILESNELFKQYSILFFNQYGSVLVMTYNENKFVPPNIGILFFKQLTMNIFTSREETVEYLQDPKQIGFYEIETVPYNKEIDWKLFVNQIENTLKNLTPEQAQQKTPFVLKNIIQHSLKEIRKFGQVQKQHSIFNSNVSLKDKKQPAFLVVKEGSRNFKNNNFPQISSQLCFLVYAFILGNEKLAKVFLLSFKINYLFNEAKKQIKRQTPILKECLRHLIRKYKNIYDQQIHQNKELAFAIFDQINQIIEKGHYDNKQQCLAPISALNQSLKAQKLFERSQPIKNVSQYCHFQPSSLPHANDIGFIQKLIVNPLNPFTELSDLHKILKSKQNGQFYWIKLVQKCFFQLSFKLTNLPISVDQTSIKPGYQISIMHEVACIYESLMTNANINSEYSFRIKNQAYSHVYLVKYLAAAIAFQICKKHQHNSYNINNYTLDLKVQKLYSNFTSLDFLARKAIQNLVVYMQNNQHKPTIFSLSNNINNNLQLKKLAKYCAQSEANQKQYLASMHNRLDQALKTLNESMNDFKARYYKQSQIIRNVEGSRCQCREQQVQNKWTKIIENKFIQCDRCIQLLREKRTLECMQGQSFRQILANIPKEQDEQYLFSFFKHLSPITAGLIKTIYQAQIPIRNKENFYQAYQNFLEKIGNLHPFSKKQCPSNKNYFTCMNDFKAQSYVIYQSPVNIYYYKYCSPTQIEYQLLNPQVNIGFRDLQWIINRSDSSNKNRQHMVYANLDKKQSSKIKQLAHLNLQQFKQYASVRVCFRTELIMLAQGILSRQMAPSTIKLHEFQRLILMNACGNISSFRAYKDNILAPEELTITRESIQQLLQKYLDQWKFNDLYCLQIIGVILNLLSKLINTSDLTVRIASRAFLEYQTMKGQKGIKSLNMKLRQLYILHSIMACFCEDICQGSRQASIVFAKIMVNYRINKRFMTQQNNSSKSAYSSHVKFYLHYFNQAVLKNIHSAVNYFASQPDYLTEVVKQIDQDITSKCKWKYISGENYVFEGNLSLNTYKINLFEGIILKNGAESSKLPQKVKQDPNYLSIFGPSSDLQVFQLRNGAIRTRSDFQTYFQQQKDAQIFFEFCTTKENQVKIRMIIKRQNIQSAFLFVPHPILEMESVYIPALYLKHYQCWIDQQRRHLIFREKNLWSMNKVGLVIMRKIQANNTGFINYFEIQYGRIITKQFQNYPLSYLTEEAHQDYFQQLLITDKQHFNNKAIQVLTSIENPQYILQILSSGKLKKTIFWLHRCDLKFTFDQKIGLISENFQGYIIPNDYRHHQLLPWRRSDGVRCLILKKIQNTFRTVTLHDFMILIPNQTVQKGGKINIVEGLVSNRILSYQIHDNFMDIRSKTRLNQIHMACLIASLDCGVPFKPLMLTNQEYCISLIRSCYGSSQLSTEQHSKVQNLTRLCIEMNLNILILCCNVLVNISDSLKNILKQNSFGFPILQQKDNRQNLLKSCKLIYRQRLQNKLISPHSKLNKIELILLGINEKRMQELRKQQKLTKWNYQQVYSPQLQEKMAKGLQNISQSYQKAQKDITHLKETIINFFQKEKQDAPEKGYNLHIKLHDALATQMLKDMDQSYKSYLRYSQKYQQIQLTKQQSKKNLIKFFLQPKQKCQKFKTDLTRYLQKIHLKANEHLDVIVGYKTVVKAKSYTDILCKPELIYEFYPKITKQNSEVIVKAIREWMLLTLQIQSLSRILLILGDKIIDKVALFRQLQSPRKEISEKDYWICFQAQMKIRIWLSQYDTYKHLRDSSSGAVSQLNMGEGKTQVIIPMIVLDNIYGVDRGNPISRINILSQLFKEAQANYFRFLSVTSFRIPIFSMHFTREVQLTKENIYRMKFVIHLLREKMLMLLDRESCLSMVLKIRQDCLKENSFVSTIGKSRDHWLFDTDSVYDIFDEVDALMTCKKSFVYSIGASEDLSQSRLRFELARVLLEIICIQMFQWLLKQKMAVIQQTYQKALQSVKKGGFPKGFRLKKNLNSKQLMEIRHKAVNIFLNDSNYRPPEFQFYEHLQEKNKVILLRFLTDQTDDSIKSITSGIPLDINPILAVRGFIAFHILQHCLMMRNGVDFGVPGEGHPKSVGVPYEAADVPSKRSQFSHPDVAIIVSYISYFGKGISYDQFNDSLHHLLDRPQSAKYYHYSLWMNIIEDEKFKPRDVMEVRQINIDSQAQISYLYQKYKFNRNTIIFWLVNKVFEKDLRQYSSSITSSSWDISYVDKSIGFSGTKDTRWLFPHYLKWSPSHNDTINGTDGKMIHQMLRSTKDILVIKEGKESLWQRFCQNVLDLQDQQIGCIIDAGAILVGKSFQNEIVPWIMKNPRFNKEKFKGITFCDEDGKWKVYDTVTLSVVQRGTSIPQHDTFVIFDQARTRGADIKMGTNLRAVVSLSPTMTKDKLMQAVGRLRKFGRNQEIYIMGTSEVFEKIDKAKEGSGIRGRVEKVIEWACQNSVSQNRNMQYLNNRLAQLHYKTVLEGAPDVQQFDSSLKSLYSGIITQKSVYDICQTSINLRFKEEHKKSQQIKKLTENVKTYGFQHLIKAYDFDDVCQREIENVVESQDINQHKYDALLAEEETNSIQICNQKLSTLDFKFDGNLKFSKNFINCTKTNFPVPFKDSKSNQLCNINFFLWQNNQLIIITQRQMTLQLFRGTLNYGYYSLLELDDFQTRFVGRFRDLSKFIPLIIGNSLDQALVHAQFFNGVQFYENQAKQILANLIKDYLRVTKQKLLPKLINNPSVNLRNTQTPPALSANLFTPKASSNEQLSLEQIVSHFLLRRRTFHSKFVNSDLEKVMIQLKSLSEGLQ